MIDILPIKTEDEGLYIQIVDNLLKELWQLNIPAVAACDFENKLKYKGGYKSQEIPWPKIKNNIQ